MLDKLNRNEQLVIGGGALLLIASFLPWHSVDTGFGTFTASGWDEGSTPWSILAVLIAAAMAVVAVLDKLTDVQIPDKLGNFTWTQLYFFGGIAVGALILIKLLDESSFLGYGFYIAVVAGAAVVAGGVMGFMQAQAGGAPSGPGSPPAAPPPPPPPPPPA